VYVYVRVRVRELRCGCVRVCACMCVCHGVRCTCSACVGMALHVTYHPSTACNVLIMVVHVVAVHQWVSFIIFDARVGEDDGNLALAALFLLCC